MICHAEKMDDAAESRAHELKRMKVIRRLEDWAAYERQFGKPIMRGNLSSPIGALAAEKASAKRAGLDEKTVMIYQCRDCEQLFAAKPQQCINCENDRENGFKRLRRESISGKTVYASMIPSTNHMQTHRAEIETEQAIQMLDPMKREVLRRNFVLYLDQVENAKEMGISRSTFQKELSAAIDCLVIHFETKGNIKLDART